MEEIQLSHQHIGRLCSAGNLLHEVQLRLERTSHSQGIPQKQSPQGPPDSLSPPWRCGRGAGSHLAQVHGTGLRGHPVFSFCSGGRRVRGEGLGWEGRERHSAREERRRWGICYLPEQVYWGKSHPESPIWCQSLEKPSPGAKSLEKPSPQAKDRQKTSPGAKALGENFTQCKFLEKTSLGDKS